MNRFLSITSILFLFFTSSYAEKRNSITTKTIVTTSKFFSTFNPPCTAPVITSQPAPTAQTVCLNIPVAAITVATSDVSATFQWYFNVIDANSGGILISGETNAMFTPSSTVAGTKYFYCVLSNGTCTTTSNTVAVVVNNYPVVSLSNTNTVGCSGTSVLSLTGANSANIIEWYNGTTLEKSITVMPNAGATVAGGNSAGNNLNQLNVPQGVSVDALGTVYVVDANNNRVQKWTNGATTGVTVAGGNGAGANANQLNTPLGIFVDTASNIYVTDGLNHRVQKWAKNATVGVTVAGGNGFGANANQLFAPSGVFVDTSGNVYVADALNHRIQKWAKNATIGVTVAGGNGSGSNANQFNTPSAVFVDSVGNIFVADINNNRVQKWAVAATSGVTVAGGNGSGSNANQLNMPSDIFVDIAGNIFIADSGNDRIQAWATDAVSGITVAGGNGNGASANQFNKPTRLFVDVAGNIFVSDGNNARIQKWKPTTSNYYTPLNSGTYTAKVTVNGCTTTTNGIVIKASPIAKITGATTVAQCETITLSGSPINGKWSSNSVNATVNATTGLVSGINAGNAIITYTYKDANNCPATPTQVVTVSKDIILPVITFCPVDITVYPDPGYCSVVLNYGTITATDNCTPAPVVTQTSGLAAWSSFPLGVTTNTFIATDANGNVATCTFKINVLDNTNPIFSNCPNNFTVNADAGKCGTIVTFPISATDNCSATISQNSGLASGSFYPIGVTSNSFTATDAAKNKVNCSFQVTVVPTDLPVIVCPASITVNNDLGFCSAKVIFDYIAASDNCGTSFTIKQKTGLARGDNYPVGTTTNTYFATDNALRTSLPCSFSITVLDTEKPKFTNCPTDITVGNDAGKCSAVVNFTLTATDLCTTSPAITTTSGLASGSTFPSGTTTNVFTATDNSKNTAQCSFKVTVTDSEKPVVTCPKDISVNNDAGRCDAVVSFTVSAKDNCTASPTITKTAGLASGAVFPSGTTTNTFSATDAANNSGTCSFKVIVTDSEKPVVTCPTDISVNNDAGRCDAVVNYTVTAKDNCTASPTIARTAGFDSGAIFPVGTTTNTFSATDAAKNASTCSFKIIVVDAEKPSFVNCPKDLTINNNAGKCTATVNFTLTATDNCTFSPTITKSAASLASGSDFPLGTTTNTFTATDATGNAATCSFKVNVFDTEKPIINCPVDVTVNNDAGKCGAVVNYSVTATDNCTASPSITQTTGLASGASFSSGTTVNTFSTADASNNASSCSFKVTVLDAEKPVFTNCPKDISVNTDAGKCGAVIIYAINAKDNCTASPTVLQTAGLAGGATFPSGSTQNTFTATDDAGNISTCNFKIIVVDAEKPVLTCPSDISVNNDAGKCGAVVNYTLTLSDNCTASPSMLQTGGAVSGATYPIGTTINAFSATDAANNVGVCSFKVIVKDIEKPIITCPNDVKVSTDLGACGAKAAFNVLAIDNCSATVSKTVGLASGDNFPVGETIESFTATDLSGNTAACSFKVIVTDAEKLVISSPIIANSVCLRSAVTLNASATSTRAMTFSWQRKGRNDANFSDVAASATYTSGSNISYIIQVVTALDSLAQYRVAFTTSCGLVYTDVVTVKPIECYNSDGLNPFPDSIKECLKTPFRVLESIYASTGGANWKNKTNWFKEKDLSKWYGVTLTGNGCDVLGLNLSNNNLSGGLPQNVAAGNNEISLPALQTFDLSFNTLAGNLPNISLPSLVTYNLSNNSFTGSIPNFTLPNLQTLDVSSNQLGFAVPNFTVASKLSNFNLSKNKFIFGNLEGKSWLNITDLIYVPQATIPISFGANKLSVQTGAADSVQTFKWYLDGVLIATTNSSTFTPIKSGMYACTVSHKTLTNAAVANKNLILQSESFGFQSFLIDLKNLKGTVVSKKTQLDWQTLSEIKLDRFEIERSADTIAFVKIGQVAAVGNSTTVQNYAFIDSLPLVGVNYYRLKIFGTTGDFSYSNRISVNFFTPTVDITDAPLTLYPNPTDQVLIVSSPTLIGNAHKFFITNALGQIVQTGELRSGDVLNIENLQQGTYFFNVENKVARFVKL